MATRRPKRVRPKRKPARPTVPQLERKIARLLAERETERARHARQISAVRRGADRRLTVMLREITSLRHHEARAQALERMLAERDAALAAKDPRDLTGKQIKETSLGGLRSLHEQDPHPTGR
jgi:hypothetical protein